MMDKIIISTENFCEQDYRITYKDGFAFTSVTYPLNLHDGIIVKVDNHSDRMGPRYNIKNREVNEYINYINEKKIEKALIILDNLEILKFCPSLKYLEIYLSDQTLEDFDFSPLYNLPEVKYLLCSNEYGMFFDKQIKIDYSKVKGLLKLNVDVNKGTLNYNKIPTLRTLDIRHYKNNKKDLSDLFISEKLENLSITQSNIKSLKGIEKAEGLKTLHLYYNRSLDDISDLKKVKKTLKTLVIQSCGKIKDFSVLKELEYLEKLTIWGSNSIENLKFINNIKDLKLFDFDINVIDGDLTPCKNVSCVRSLINRRHYNLKDEDLPKNETIQHYGPFNTFLDI